MLRVQVDANPSEFPSSENGNVKKTLLYSLEDFQLKRIPVYQVTYFGWLRNPLRHRSEAMVETIMFAGIYRGLESF